MDELQLHRRAWAEIDLDAAAHNFRAVRARLRQGTALCCVIKANAYGHGAVALARLYEELGVDWFAVASIEEALRLHHGGIGRPILILGYTPPLCARLLAEHKLTQCVYSYEYAAMLAEQAAREGVTVDIHLKLDTGMGRLGFHCRGGADDAAGMEDMRRTCRLPALRVRGAFTHFASADEGEDGEAFSREQVRHFTEAVEVLEASGVSLEMRHAANSAAIADYPDAQMDMVRAGIVLYGLAPSAQVREQLALQPVMTLKSTVSHVKTLRAGETVSYGRTYVAERDMRVATIPIGYADGYRRANAKGASLLVHGVLCPVVGRVCMDQLMIDVSALDDVRIGDEVTVFGSAPAMSAEQLAALDHTIGYEVLCGVGARVPRVYVSGGKVVYLQDHL